LDEVAATPGAGDVPDRREICPPAWDDRYAKRAYFILDRNGVVRYARIQANPLDLLKADDVLQAMKDSGAS
jgi:alkyl hydroperoxide reductase subunit AhpC